MIYKRKSLINEIERINIRKEECLKELEQLNKVLDV